MRQRRKRGVRVCGRFFAFRHPSAHGHDHVRLPPPPTPALFTRSGFSIAGSTPVDHHVHIRDDINMNFPYLRPYISTSHDCIPPPALPASLQTHHSQSRLSLLPSTPPFFICNLFSLLYPTSFFPLLPLLYYFQSPPPPPPRAQPRHSLFFLFPISSRSLPSSPLRLALSLSLSLLLLPCVSHQSIMKIACYLEWIMGVRGGPR